MPSSDRWEPPLEDPPAEAGDERPSDLGVAERPTAPESSLEELESDTAGASSRDAEITQSAEPRSDAEHLQPDELADRREFQIERTRELHGELRDPIKEQRTTTAIVTCTRPDGSEVRIVASSDERLPRAIRASLGENEIGANGPGHAEVTALAEARRLGYTPLDVSASRPICGACEPVIREQGVVPITSLKETI
jgi:hypothetical protein